MGIVEVRSRRLGNRAVADHGYSIGRDALGENSVAHIVAQNDHARCTREGPAMRSLPKVDPFCGTDNLAPEGHVWIEVADVVDERATSEARHKCSGDTGERWIG